MKLLLLGLLFFVTHLSYSAPTQISEVITVSLDDGREILAAANGLTLYTFDKDSNGQSSCFGRCLKIWPALTTKKITVPRPFGIHLRPNGVKQLTHHNRPLYFFRSDRKKGDIRGDGLQGVWHIITQ